jgi:hypothetical protein
MASRDFFRSLIGSRFSRFFSPAVNQRSILFRQTSMSTFFVELRRYLGDDMSPATAYHRSITVTVSCCHVPATPHPSPGLYNSPYSLWTVCLPSRRIRFHGTSAPLNCHDNRFETPAMTVAHYSILDPTHAYSIIITYSRCTRQGSRDNWWPARTRILELDRQAPCTLYIVRFTGVYVNNLSHERSRRHTILDVQVFQKHSRRRVKTNHRVTVVHTC